MESLNPATGETIAVYEELTPEKVGARLDQATDAFRAWRRTPHAERARSLVAAAGAHLLTPLAWTWFTPLGAAVTLGIGWLLSDPASIDRSES